MLSANDDCSPNDCGYESCCGVEMSLDLLYWTPRRSDLDYAIKGTIQGEFDAPFGSTERINLDYDTGFRLAIFKDCGRFVDVGARYTHYKTECSDSVSSSTANIWATRGYPSEINAPNSELGFASGTYEVELNQIDLETRYCCPINCLNALIRPFAGLNYTFLDQEEILVYDGDIGTDPAIFYPADLIVQSVNIDAYGGYIGLESMWNPCYTVLEFSAELQQELLLRKLNVDTEIIYLIMESLKNY